MKPSTAPPVPFLSLIDLAAERLGGRAIQANDEFFAEKENLLKPGRGEFIVDKYTDRGKWMDGWETRRRRTPGHDWCVIKLAFPGIVKGVDVDTNHFLGNNPTHASLDACMCEGDPGPDATWKEIIPKSPIQPGSHNYLPTEMEFRATHIRLNIYPDGGVARLRVHGWSTPDPSRFKKGEVLDLAAMENGGLSVACSDMFFSNMNNLLQPGRAINMGDGWETKRRRGPGYDWVIVKLGHPGSINRIEVDTNFFKGNFPDECSIEACHLPGVMADIVNVPPAKWTEILPRTKLRAHEQRLFESELKQGGPYSHVRLNIYPDGGVSRMRVWGTPE